MATSNETNILSLISEGDLSATDFRFVKVGAAANGCVVCTSNTDIKLGIRQNSPYTGDIAKIYTLGSRAKLTLVGTVTIGAMITASTSGGGIATTTSKDFVGAIALQGGDANDVIDVLVVGYLYTTA
jgi:hypothetical protein